MSCVADTETIQLSDSGGILTADVVVSLDPDNVLQATVGGLFASGATLPPGIILAYGAAAAPTGWLICNGAAVSRSTYASLYAIIGTTYGVGDGSTTFNVPDLQGRVPVGLAGVGGHSDATVLANNEGVVLASRRPRHNGTVNDPGHTHSQLSGGVNTGGSSALALVGTTGTTSGQIVAATTGVTVGPHTGAEPLDTPAYLVLNYIIRT